jgi:hypothetical protein
MKALLALGLLGLSGCTWVPEMIATAVIGTSAGSVSALGRAPPDVVVSLITGRDCSAVRLEQGKSYCRPTEPKPEPPPFCTRTLAAVECWQDPATLTDHPKEVADGPLTLTPEQEANRTRRWPWY